MEDFGKKGIRKEKVRPILGYIMVQLNSELEASSFKNGYLHPSYICFKPNTLNIESKIIPAYMNA